VANNATPKVSPTITHTLPEYYSEYVPIPAATTVHHYHVIVYSSYGGGGVIGTTRAGAGAKECRPSPSEISMSAGRPIGSRWVGLTETFFTTQ